MYWRFLYDVEKDYKDRLHDTSLMFIETHEGFMIAFNGDDEPMSWYDFPETNAKECGL